MKYFVPHRGFIAFAAFALSLWLCGGRLAAAAIEDIPWDLVGNATYENSGEVALVPNVTVTDQVGAMWDPCTINLNDSFNLTFTVNLGGNEFGCGADGMAFVLQTTGTGAIGADSGEHGYDAGSIGPDSLAVILDTYQNVGGNYQDPDYESLGIEDNDAVNDVACDATGPVAITGPCRPGILPGDATASNAQNMTINYLWTPSGADATLQVTVNGSVQAVWTVDNYATLFGADTDAAYFGFTGSDGGSFNIEQAGLDAGSTVNNGQDVASFCANPTPTVNANPTLTITPNICVTQPPTVTNTNTPGPTNTFTNTPTPYPTVCGGTPGYVGGAVLLGGQPGNTNPSDNYTYDVPSVVPDALVLVEVLEPSGGTSATSMSFGGTPLTLKSSQTVAGSANVAGGTWALYYLTTSSLAAGNTTLTVNYNDYSADSSMLVQIYVIGHVSGSSPFGTIGTPGTVTGSGNTPFTRTLTPEGPYSMIMDFMVGAGCLSSGAITSSQTNTNLWGQDSDGTNTWADYTIGGAPGTPVTMSYDWSAPCGQTLDSWLVELEAPVSCGTNTFTPSPTITPTMTDTETPTETSTATASRTDTATASPTKTSTLTWTPSSTATPTDTSTPTPTATDTATSSSTVTSSDTATRSDTATYTFTPTESATSTSTPTFSDTATQSDTATSTSTPTESATSTASPTSTGTPTDTPSVTQSVTFTDSPTLSDTPTATPTFTPTFTSTSTLSSTMTQTFTFTSTDTDTPSSTPSFTQSFTFTSTDTSTSTPTFSDTYTQTSTFTDSPTSTVTPTFTDSPTVTNTVVPVPVNVTVSVYNSAGELVKVLYQGGAESVPSNISVSGDLVLAGTQSVLLNLNTTLADGQTSVAWNGSNNNGQPVTSGVYYFQVVLVNNFGNTTTFDQSVQVLGQGDNSQPLSIFNSAGELVWSGALPAGTTPTASLALQSPVMIPNVKDLDIEVGSSTESWNGDNLQGAPVSPGTYLLQLTGIQPGGAILVQTKQFVVLASKQGLPSADATIVPNPWRAGQPLQLIYAPAGGGIYGAATLYSMLGQRLESASDPSATGTVTMPATTHYPAGIYLLDFRQMSGSNTVVREILKLAIIQ
jgi:Bacterial lectin